jgi:hypothetical protein
MTKTITGYQNPHNCYRKAQDLLDELEEKWDPGASQPQDYEKEPQPEDEEETETRTFDPRITTYGTIADTFRIFTKRTPRNLHDVAPDTSHDTDAEEEGVTIYTDGFAKNNGGANARSTIVD